MRNFISILIVVALTTMISCNKEKQDPTNENNSSVILKSNAAEYHDAISNPSLETSDPFELGPIVVNGDKVEVTVSYSGGCAAHTFNIIWDETVLYSDPPKISIVITHDANGDNCEAYITEVLSFRLDSLISGSTEAEIGIDGYSGWDSEDSSVYEGNKYEFNFEESDVCNLIVTAKEAMCGWGLYGSTWFALEDSISAGIPDYYFNKFLQPVSVDESLSSFQPVPGKKYSIGAKIDTESNPFPDYPVCLAYPGPSIPVRIMCITELQ